MAKDVGRRCPEDTETAESSDWRSSSEGDRYIYCFCNGVIDVSFWTS